MPAAPQFRPSFSTASRWRIGFDVALRTALVLAVVVMLNDLGVKFFHRFYLSSLTRVELSPRTLNVLHSLTNRVDVTLYYDRADEFLPDIVALLNEYRSVNPKIFVHTVDYLNDPGGAEKTKAQYRQFFTSASDKNLVIFDCGGRVKIVPGAALQTYQPVLKGYVPRADNPEQKELEFERRPVSFNGEQAFTAMLLALSNPQPAKAYFLQHHGEPSLTDSGNFGYQKFASVLQENYVVITNLDWVGNAGVPMDCNLLVIAGPDEALKVPELQQIDQYLREGGRLLVLFNYASQGHPTGLENILQTWGVAVVDDVVQDPDHTISTRDVVVDQFGKHPVVNSLSQVQLQLYLPRPILKLPPNASANAPQVDELFATSAGATLLGSPNEPPHQYPLACAIEQRPVAGAVTPRGNTRIIVVGDSIFLGNYYIEGGTGGANRDFLNACVNWLCDRPTLVEGIGPRPVTEYRLQITRHQQRQLSWLLLGALPGGVLFIGWLVWLVRRK
jgi:hypothetical protein